MFGSIVDLLILALVTRASVASPVSVPKNVQSENAHCIPRARDLLTTLRHVLEKDVKCSNQKTSPFTETECLQNIANDLDYHQSILTKYVGTLDQKANAESITELKTITDSIHHLQQSCKLLPKPDSSKYTWIPTNSFEDRKDLCKQLKGFQVRTITINRALGYVSAGEYKN